MKRTSEQVAQAIEDAVYPISELTLITEQERNELIQEASIKYGISEEHIRRVGNWRVKDEKSA